jgi:hypothetical protein
MDVGDNDPQRQAVVDTAPRGGRTLDEVERIAV